MASELQTDFQTGLTIYFLVRNSIGQIWNTNTGALEAYLTANYSKYKVAGTEQGTASAFYTGNMPAAAADIYSIVAKQQAGGSPAEADVSVGWGNIFWNGTAVQSLASVFTDSMSKFEATASKQSLAGAVLKLTAKFEQDNGQTIATTHKTDGTTFMTQAITKNSTLTPVQTLDKGT